jgi:hypothetical protein
MKTVDMMSFGDVRVFCSPLLPLAPKIGVRQICLKDGSPLLSPAFIERENRWWRAQFGEVEQAFQTADGIFMPPGMYEKVRKHLADEVERDILHGAGVNTATANVPGASLTAEKIRESVRALEGLMPPPRKRFSIYDPTSFLDFRTLT